MVGTCPMCFATVYIGRIMRVYKHTRSVIYRDVGIVHIAAPTGSYITAWHTASRVVWHVFLRCQTAAKSDVIRWMKRANSKLHTCTWHRLSLRRDALIVVISTEGSTWLQHCCQLLVYMNLVSCLYVVQCQVGRILLWHSNTLSSTYPFALAGFVLFWSFCFFLMHFAHSPSFHSIQWRRWRIGTRSANYHLLFSLHWQRPPSRPDGWCILLMHIFPVSATKEVSTVESESDSEHGRYRERMANTAAKSACISKGNLVANWLEGRIVLRRISVELLMRWKLTVEIVCHRRLDRARTHPTLLRRGHLNWSDDEHPDVTRVQHSPTIAQRTCSMFRVPCSIQGLTFSLHTQGTTFGIDILIRIDRSRYWHPSVIIHQSLLWRSICLYNRLDLQCLQSFVRNLLDGEWLTWSFRFYDCQQ